MVLLVIDVQKEITNEMLYQVDAVLATIQRLIAAARANGVEVIYVRHDDGAGQALTKGAAGFEIATALMPAPQEKVFDKRVNSPFRQTGLLSYLQEKGERELVVTGLQTEYCIDATVKTAFEHGFTVLVPALGNTTVDNAFMTGEASYRYYNQWMWPGRYATCLSREACIQKMEQAGNASIHHAAVDCPL